VRRIELRDEAAGLEAFVVVDHELFPRSAGGTRMLPDVDVDEVARLARAMTWKFAACHVPYAGAKAGIRFSGGDARRSSTPTVARSRRSGTSSSPARTWAPILRTS
jgi:glutamate dehydrogenase (NAD(P)+)